MSQGFFVWESVASDNSVLITEKPSPLVQFGLDKFTSGRKIKEPVPQFEFVLDSLNQNWELLDDVPIVGERMLLISNRLSMVLIEAGVDNIDFYPCRIINPLTRKVHEDYMLTNILDCIFCLDWETSRLTVADANREDIESIDEMKLIESRIESELLFRLGEEPDIVIVHKSVKDAVERAGIRGVIFVEADGYVETGLNWESNLMGSHISTLVGEED